MRLPTALMLTLMALLVVGLTACVPPTPQAEPPAGTLTVGSKDFAESEILGHLIAERLNAVGIAVKKRIPMGGTPAVRAGLLDGTIDVYAEYTGTGLTFLTPAQASMLSTAATKDPDLLYRELSLLDKRDSGVIWLPPAPGNNTFVIAVPRTFAQANKLTTLEDFAAYVNRGGRVKLIAGRSVLSRPDSLTPFERTYGFKLKPDQVQEIAAIETLYGEQAAGQGAGGVNAVLGYSTDAGIESNDLVALTDTLQSQIAYQPSPVLMSTTNARYPEVAVALAPVFEKLTTETLASLNARVIEDQEEPATVALEWLRQNGLNR